MEKLQQALQKARTQREALLSQEGPAPTPGAAAPATPAPQTDATVKALWEDLDEVTLDPRLLEKNRVVSMEAGRASNTFDILRTKVQLLMQKNKWSRLAVTSPTVGCGKTTMACNLALGMTRQKGVRTILIELDLSRPMIAKMLGITPKFNITEVLAGDVGFEKNALRVRQNVAIAATRRRASDPTSVLLAKSTEDTIAEIEARYKPDLVIFDLPPVLVSGETRAFLSNVDCALMMAKAETTTLAQIDLCEKEIAQHTNVLGVVLNQCRHLDELNHSEGYYYYGG